MGSRLFNLLVLDAILILVLVFGIYSVVMEELEEARKKIKQYGENGDGKGTDESHGASDTNCGNS